MDNTSKDESKRAESTEVAKAILGFPTIQTIFTPAFRQGLIDEIIADPNYDWGYHAPIDTWTDIELQSYARDVEILRKCESCQCYERGVEACLYPDTDDFGDVYPREENLCVYCADELNAASMSEDD